jgi:hypothetical protein
MPNAEGANAECRRQEVQTPSAECRKQNGWNRRIRTTIGLIRIRTVTESENWPDQNSLARFTIRRAEQKIHAGGLIHPTTRNTTLKPA